MAQFGQQTWQSDSGLPQNTVHSVLQTTDGFLWIATEAGLVRFDGMDFRVYDTENTPQLHSDIISNLTQDPTGALWISTSAGLARLKAGQFTSIASTAGLPAGAVTSTFVSTHGVVLAITAAGIAVLKGDRFQIVPGTEQLQPADGSSNIAEDGHGEIWVLGDRDLFHISGDQSRADRLPPPASLGELHALAVTRSGQVWIGGRGGIEVLDQGSPVNINLHGRLPSDDVLALSPDEAGGMWIGTSRGLAHWTARAITVLGGSEGLAGAAVQRLFRDREDTLWAVTNRGIARLTPERVDLLTRQSRLNGVLSIFEDREGSVWFGTDNAGLTVLREQAFSTISEADGLTSGSVRAIFQDHEGVVWVGTNGGGLNRVDHGRASPLHSRSALSSDVVLAISEAAGDLWVGTPNGLNRIRNGAVRVFTTQDGLPDDFIRSLYTDTDGSLWIGTRNGLSHLAHGAFSSFSTLDGLGSDLIGAILRSARGDLWIGTLGGLSRQNGSAFVNFTTGNGLGSDAVTSLLEDIHGELWIGTQNAGLSRWRDGKFIALAPAKTGLPETVYGMLEDSAGDLWFSSRRGIYRVPSAELDTFAEKATGSIPLKTYGTADGMRMSEGSIGGHPAAWRMRDGSLWFATLDGAAAVNPEFSARNDLPPPTAIEQILLDDRTIDSQTVDSSRPLLIPPGGRRIEVRYAGLSLVAPQKMRFRYKLDGFDKGWIEAGARRSAFYTNLPPGSFRFLVLSANNDGVWSSEPAGFDLKVQPALLQTRWFYGLVLILSAAVAFAIYRWRVLLVEAQYRAVLAERGRIAREIHDTLAQGYVAISVQLELTGRLLQTSTDAALKQLEQTKELVRGGLAEARSSIWNLRSQSEAETLPSLLAAMTQDVTQERSSPDGPALKLDVKGSYRPVSASVEKEILRIAQESVANSVRHSGAKRIRVVLRYDATTLQMQIIDDGRGFADPAADRSGAGHFGIRGMRERAARIGATLKVESAPGKGTVVNLHMDPRKAEKEDLP